MLLKEAHKRATSLGYETAVLLGHKDYYPRFGYCKVADYGIKFPFDAPSEYCQVIELIPDALKSIKGIVRYPAVFFEKISRFCSGHSVKIELEHYNFYSFTYGKEPVR